METLSSKTAFLRMGWATRRMGSLPTNSPGEFIGLPIYLAIDAEHPARLSDLAKIIRLGRQKARIKPLGQILQRKCGAQTCLHHRLAIGTRNQ